MGIQINGQTDTISAVDGALTVSGAELPTVTNLNATGIVTASGIVVSAGNTSAPAISPSEDSNTGIFFPSADTIAFGEGGSEAARIDSSGRLGIGTINPGAKLDVFGVIASDDIVKCRNGTVEISDSLNVNNWQFQVTNSNNSFATGNALIRAEYTGTNSGSNIKIFSGYADSTETSYISGDGRFYGKGVTGQRDNSALLGKSHNAGGSTIDLTALTSNSFKILEIFGDVNPNSAGSAYVDPLHMYVYNGVGYNGSSVTQYIYTNHIAPPARDIFPSGSSISGNICDAVWYNGSSESDTCPHQSGSHYVRLKIYNYNATYGSGFTIRYFVRN